MSNQIEDARFAFEGLGRQVDQVERATLKLKNAFYGTHIGGALILAGSINKLSKAAAGLYKDQAAIDKASDNLTITSGILNDVVLQNNLALGLLGMAYQYLNDKKTDSNKHTMSLLMRFVSLGASLFTVTSLLAIFTIAMGLFSLATQGANSPILEMVDNMFLLEDAVHGLQFAMTGEGEGGFFSGILGSALLAIPILLLFGSTWALVTLGLGIGGTIFHTVLDATGSFHLSMMALIGTFTAFGAIAITAAGKFAFLGPIFQFLSVTIIGGINSISASWFGASKVMAATRLAFVGGMALIAAGLYGLVAYASGAMGTLEAVIVGVLSAIALGLGLFLIGLAAIPAAIIATIVFIFATAYRFRDEINDVLSSLWNGIKDGGSDLLSWLMTLGSDLLDWLSGLPKAVSDIVSSIEEMIGDGVVWVTKQGSDIVDWFLGLPDAIIGGITSGIDLIYQKFGDLMSWLEEQKDAITDIFDIDMPSIPGSGMVDTISSFNPFEKRAKGGPVTGGRPYIVGEKGPELFVPGSSGGIVPNNQLSSGGGGGPVTLNINVAGVTDRSDKRALAREIGDMLTQELRRQGGAPTRGRF